MSTPLSFCDISARYGRTPAPQQSVEEQTGWNSKELFLDFLGKVREQREKDAKYAEEDALMAMIDAMNASEEDKASGKTEQTLTNSLADAGKAIVAQSEEIMEDGTKRTRWVDPTQTLTDLLTIRSLKGRLDHLTIGLCGDLKFGRTVHSLIEALVRYENITFILISPEELRIPSYIRNGILQNENIFYREVVRLEDALPELDLLYMTRVQKERFFNEDDYVRMKDFYILDANKMKLAGPDMLVLHPLPRVNEISVEIDNDPRAVYFKQAQYGVYVRMALIMTLLGIHL